ncbi:DUF982 domain-containing protein [Rhizobium herbae]|uniref:DUF982 domain-containing protein n=1 Tax=Rhizobium herbae TaxID=508661 RepID=A0ABS4EQL6_9HYPH|nr:DUF982 domain-containing protein [Rhizobium herbae]MBP1860240.1 hypothetical protein [Rhizobium herbae]
MGSNMPHHFPALWILMSVGEKYRRIDTVDAAAQLLIEQWPSHDGSKYIDALRACRDALRDIVPAYAAREALMCAADEALICYICVIQGEESRKSIRNTSSGAKHA